MRAFLSLGPRFAAALASLVVGLDVVTKALAERHLETPVALLAGARLQLGHNPGVAFGALADTSGPIVALVGGSIVIGLLVAVWRRWLPVAWPAVGLLLGGALANLIDRIPDGQVTDFIDPPRWPAFNVADIAITLALASLLLSGHAAGSGGSAR